jgi:L-amino acid N-acyltransferase
MQISRATPEHFEQIIEIYNWAIAHSTSTLDTELKNLHNYEQFLSSLLTYPFYVILQKNYVLGWACLKPYSDRKAYEETVELSIYIDSKFHNQGLAKLLLAELFNQAKKFKIHTIISRITTDSQASIHLHKKFGFIEVGTLKEVGNKFGKRLDVIIMQKFLKSSA